MVNIFEFDHYRDVYKDVYNKVNDYRLTNTNHQINCDLLRDVKFNQIVKVPNHHVVFVFANLSFDRQILILNESYHLNYQNQLNHH